MSAGLEAAGVAVSFSRGVQAVAGVDLTVAPGTTLGLVGESGCGKSTLARALAGLQGLSAGRILLDGARIDTLRGRARRQLVPRAVQMVFQDPVASLSPRLNVRALLDEPARIHGLDPAAHAAQTAASLHALGLAPDLAERYPHQLSGGQARRVAIARALALRPRILIADEPTAGLDVSIQGDLLNLLARLRRDLGLGLLLISHNLNVVGRVTDRVAVMYLGRIVEQGPTARVFQAPAHPYTAALLAANPSLDPARRLARVPLPGEVPSPADPPSGCRFHPRCPRAQGRCRVEDPLLPPLAADGQAAACFFPLHQQAAAPG